MINLKKISFLLFILLISVIGIAQDKKVEMADVMRSNGKIYVVIGVVLIILFGLLLYVFRLDRKLNNLEKETKN